MHRKYFASMALFTCASIFLQAQKVEVPETPNSSQVVTQPVAKNDLSITRVHTEDWTMLPLDKSKLDISSLKVMSLGKFEAPEYTRELLRVEWRTGDPIDLYVIKPHGIEKPPAVLYLYDYRWDTERFRNDQWCKQAIQGGVAAIGFVSALSGQRFHSPRPMKQWFISELQEALSTSTHDVQMLLNYLASRGDVDTSHVGMLGEGSGGAIAILAASVDERITAIELLNPFGDWPDWLRDSRQIPDDERPTYLKPEFLQKVSTLDPLTYLPQLKNKSVRILQVMSDTVTPPSARDKLAAAAPQPDQVIRYQDSSEFVKAARSGSLSSWIPEHMRPSAQAVSQLQQQK
jgi:dienelactone hydrolase